MHAENSVTPEQRKKHKYHYAVLYLLYDYVAANQSEGHVLLWAKKRWDPQKNSAYESIALEIQSADDPYKLEAWVFDGSLIILVTDVENPPHHIHIRSGLHPVENHRLDINDPDSIKSGISTIDDYLQGHSHPRCLVVDLSKRNAQFIWVICIILLLTTLSLFLRK